MPKYGKIRGAIRWYSRLPNLRKPIFAPIYSRLLTWVNTVYRGSGGRYSRYFAGGFALRRCRNSIRQYSAAPKCEFRNQFPLLPFYSVNGLRRQVVADAADARNFGGNACSDVLQQRPVKLGTSAVITSTVLMQRMMQDAYWDPCRALLNSVGMRRC